MIFAFDFETHLIGPDVCPCGEVHDQFPPAVCMSFAKDDGESGVVLWQEGLAMLWQALERGDTMVGAETAFDVLVSAVNADGLAGVTEYPPSFDDWVTKWVEAYEAGRVHDVCIRQKLLDLSDGSYRWQTFSDGRRIRIGYDLATVSKRQTGRELSKPTKETKDTHWRLRYALLDGVPISVWPEAAYTYALEDAVATLEDYIAQECWRETKQGERILDRWNGVQGVAYHGELDPLQDAHAQTCHALWLKATSGYGIRVDPMALRQFERRVRRDYITLCEQARRSGMAKRKYWRDLKKMREIKHPMRGNREWKQLCAELDAELPEAYAVWDELVQAGLVTSKHTRNMKAARARMVDVCMAKHKPIPHTDKFDPDVHDVFDKIAIDSDACRLSEDDALIVYSELSHVSKMISADIPQLRQGVDRPIHTHYEVCLETGRISSAGPNITNRARGEDDVAGDRECFAPPPGFVYIDYDYAQLELYCLAQVCLWVLGFSKLAEVLLANRDPHTAFACLIVAAEIRREVPYEEGERALVEDGETPDKKTGVVHPLHPLHKQMKKARNAAKGCNFGRPGGLGAETMVSYAARSYRVVLPQQRWEELLDLWDTQWPEMPEYFDFINSLEYSPGDFNVPQAWSGRMRGGARYCAACNSFYQGLGADVAKLAGWYIFKACFVPGVDPELFGCRIVNFVHDQFLVEAEESRAAAAAKRVEYWAGKAAIEVLPDVGWKMAEKSEAILARRWSKQAKKVTDAEGRLIAWEDKRLFSEEIGSDDEELSDEAA